MSHEIIVLTRPPESPEATQVAALSWTEWLSKRKPQSEIYSLLGYPEKHKGVNGIDSDVEIQPEVFKQALDVARTGGAWGEVVAFLTECAAYSIACNRYLWGCFW